MALAPLAGWAALGWRRRTPRVRPFLCEAALVIALFAFWQPAGTLARSVGISMI